MKHEFKVAIKSCQAYASRREAQLATWLPELDADFFWILGNPTPANGGPVIMDSFSCDVSDAFENIAPKILHACHYALNENVEHLFVCDDDTYVQPKRLAESGFWNFDYVGHLRVTGLDYNKNIPYAQGSAYWLSARSMEQIVLRPDILKNGIIDDGAVGQALIDKVPFTHDWRYEPGPFADRAPLKGNNVITTHKCLPNIMWYVHDQWRKS